MGRYVKSISDTTKLNKSLKDLQEEFSYHKEAIKRNNKELQKINDQIQKENEKEIKRLTEKLRSLESETQWVKNSEPALKIDSNNMLKKLDIL